MGNKKCDIKTPSNGGTTTQLFYSSLIILHNFKINFNKFTYSYTSIRVIRA